MVVLDKKRLFVNQKVVGTTQRHTKTLEREQLGAGWLSGLFSGIKGLFTGGVKKIASLATTSGLKSLGKVAVNSAKELGKSALDVGKSALTADNVKSLAKTLVTDVAIPTAISALQGGDKDEVAQQAKDKVQNIVQKHIQTQIIKPFGEQIKEKKANLAKAVEETHPTIQKLINNAVEKVSANPTSQQAMNTLSNLMAGNGIRKSTRRKGRKMTGKGLKWLPDPNATYS